MIVFINLCQSVFMQVCFGCVFQGAAECVENQTAAFSNADVYNPAKSAQKPKNCNNTAPLGELSEYDKVIIPKKSRNNKKAHESGDPGTVCGGGSGAVV